MRRFLYLLPLLLLFACTSAEELHLGALQHFTRGNELMHAKLYQQAIKEYDMAIALEDQQEAFFYNKGLCYYELVLYERAADNFRMALDLNADFGEAWYNLSLALNKLDQPEEAYMAYEKYQNLYKTQSQAKAKAAEAKAKEPPKVISALPKAAKPPQSEDELEAKPMEGEEPSSLEDSMFMDPKPKSKPRPQLPNPAAQAR